MVGTPAEQRWGGMSRESRIGHLLGSRELADMPTEVILRGAAIGAKTFLHIETSLRVKHL